MNTEEQEELRSKIECLDESGATGLRDWAAIRAHLKRHDDEMVGDYEDDINTMLVFAGLFSAVITAFIIDSYKWLQQDSSQTIIQLLMQISSQLASPPTTSAPYLATQHGPSGAITPNSFEPTSFAVWINCLWILSLLFALTSALFSIIIKQWLREYVLWDSVLFPAREAVLLRHIRYDALERWKVPVIISIVPAMLELALVLFLCGAAILLWTLNTTVALVITFFGGLAFAAACAVNMLPVFFHRCPYKSAVGWICVSVWNILNKWGKIAFSYLSNKVHHRNVRTRGPRRYNSWRHRDLERNMHWGIPVQWELHPDMDTDMQLEMIELIILFHALAWVCVSTQDDRLLARVQQCTTNFHGTSRKHICLAAGMHAVCQIFHLDATQFFKTVRSLYFHEKQEGADIYGTYMLLPKQQSGLSVTELWQGPVPEQSVVQMVADVLLSVVQACIDDMFPTISSPGPRPSEEQVGLLIDALCFLLYLARSVSSTWQDSFAEVLISFWSKLTNDEYGGPWMLQDGPQYPGFKATVFQLLTYVGTVYINDAGLPSVHRLSIATAPEHCAELAIKLYDRSTRPHAKAEDFHLFVVAANDALHSYCGSDSKANTDSLADLISCVEQTIESSLQRGVKNCGSYSSLPWITTLLTFVQRAPPSLASLVPMSLVDTLDNSVHANLITGTEVHEQIKGMRTKLKFLAKHVPGSPTHSRARYRRLASSTSDPSSGPTEYVAFGGPGAHARETSATSSTGLLMPELSSPISPPFEPRGPYFDIEMVARPSTRFSHIVPDMEMPYVSSPG